MVAVAPLPVNEAKAATAVADEMFIDIGALNSIAKREKARCVEEVVILARVIFTHCWAKIKVVGLGVGQLHRLRGDG